MNEILKPCLKPYHCNCAAQLAGLRWRQIINDETSKRKRGHKQDITLDFVSTTLAINAIDSVAVDNVVAHVIIGAICYFRHLNFSHAATAQSQQKTPNCSRMQQPL